MDITEIVKRLEQIETEARNKRQYELEDSVGRLIEDIIEFDLEQERKFRQEVSNYIDDKIENVLILFSAIVLIYFFIPSYPRPILSKTDNLITFSSGIILFIIGFKNIFFSTKN